MIKFLQILIFCLSISFQLIYPQSKINFHSPDNTKLFADYLFCEKDYLRAFDEYNDYLKTNYNDTVEFKAGLSLQKISSYDKALSLFNEINKTSHFYSDAGKEYARTLFLKKDFALLRKKFQESDSSNNSDIFISRLNKITFLYTDEASPYGQNFISLFPENEQSYLKKFYDWKNDPPYKSPLLAGILSAVVPGLGKVYTENYTDGLFAAILTGVFGYLAYTNFKADHKFRAWTFTGVSAFFYAGNIYGSAASAQIYNAKIKFNFEMELHNFLDAFHYLSGDYNFCR